LHFDLIGPNHRDRNQQKNDETAINACHALILAQTSAIGNRHATVFIGLSLVRQSGFPLLTCREAGMSFVAMKWKLSLCLFVLAVAGCASSQQDVFTGYRNLGFTVDSIPPPVEGLTTADVAGVYGSTVDTPTRVYPQGQ
jgi:hypothetical protein